MENLLSLAIFLLMKACLLYTSVTNLTDYGCFVEILDGVEGLVHVSEMDWTNKNIHPSKVVSLGDTVEVMAVSYTHLY